MGDAEEKNPIKVDKPINLFKEFKEHSIAEFFKKNRQMLGYSGKIKSLTTAVHEYVTNALDACEEASILPNIYVKLQREGPNHYKLIVEDNGPGIPKKFVPRAFGTMLAGTKFHRFQQARGQQGIGASGVIMFSQITTGKPTKIVTSQGNGKIYECHLSVDVKTNQAKIKDETEYPGDMRGTRLESDLKAVMYQKGEYSVDEYIRRTALANPHAKITYIDPDNLTSIYDRAIETIPPRPRTAKPHPKGVEVDDLLSFASITKARTVKSFLTNEFARMSSAKAGEIEKKVSFDMNKRPKDMTWSEAEEIIKAIKETSFIAPPTDVLIPISEDHLEKALKNILKPDFQTVLTRPPTVYRGGVPFVAEVALAYGGKAGKSNGNKGEEGFQTEMMRFANRVPLLFDAGGCAITNAINNVEWKRYGIKEGNPLTILVNFTSIHVPYTGAGKQAVSEDDEIIKDIRLALMDAGRKLGLYVSGVRRKTEKEQKMKLLQAYLDPVAESLAEITGKSKDDISKKLQKVVDSKYAEEEEEAEEEEIQEELDEENGES